jgi:LacI family transcriptional regulator
MRSSGLGGFATLEHGWRCSCDLGFGGRPSTFLGTASAQVGGSLRVAPRSKVPNTTIIDIAAASGVSVATVSRIINNKPDVADDTRQRVLRVMDEIGFAPQNAWRQIRSGRTRLIAVHVPQEFNPPAYRLVMSAALGVEDAGYSINIITRTLSDAELLGIFRSRQADGIILLEILIEDRRAELLRDHGYPFVMIGRRTDNTGLSFADVDVEHGIGLAVEHLVSLGHRRIGLLTIDPVVRNDTYGFVTWALRGYELACARYGLPGIRQVGAPTGDAMADAAGRLLDENPDLTACIAPQEQSVIGLFKAASRRRIRIPVDLSVVAMLDESLTELATPPLTTIGFPSDDMGRAAARILLDRLDRGRIMPDQVLVAPELIVRGSTARPIR